MKKKPTASQQSIELAGKDSTIIFVPYLSMDNRFKMWARRPVLLLVILRLGAENLGFNRSHERKQPLQGEGVK